MKQWKEDALSKAIATEDGVEAFRRALDSGLSQVIVSPQDLHEMLDAPPARGQASGGVDSGGIPVSPEEGLEKSIAKTWCDTLGVAAIGDDESFFALGGHSLLAMQVVTRLRGMYRVDLTLREFFEAPTIAGLCAIIRDKILRDIENLSDGEVQDLIATEPPPLSPRNG
jgi:acyl carrier protein